MSGRHAAPDLVTVALGTACTAAGAALQALLAVMAHEPRPRTPEP